MSTARAVIDQAKGVLIEPYKVSADQAFQLLAQASMHRNRKVRDIADHLVHTSELPVPQPRSDGRRPGPPGQRGRLGPGTAKHS